jgi:hypothetical protein
MAVPGAGHPRGPRHLVPRGDPAAGTLELRSPGIPCWCLWICYIYESITDYYYLWLKKKWYVIWYFSVFVMCWNSLSLPIWFVYIWKNVSGSIVVLLHFLKDPTAQAHGKFFVAPANMQIEKSQGKKERERGKKIVPTNSRHHETLVRASSSRARSNSHQWTAWLGHFLQT